MIPHLGGLLAGLLGRKRACPNCGEVQILRHAESGDRYTCNRCKQSFPASEWKPARHQDKKRT